MKVPSWDKWLENWPAKVLALVVALLLFVFNRFDSLQVRTFQVPLRFKLDTTLVQAEEYQQKVRVTVRGAKELVAAVTEADLDARVDYTSHQREGVFTAAIDVSRRGASADDGALEVTVEPQDLSVRLEKRVARSVPVQPAFQGQPGRDYQLAGFTVSPKEVTVSGPRSKVEAITSLQTEPIELRGKTENFTFRAQVEPGSALLEFPYGSKVEVQGIMTSSLASQVIESVVPGAINLNSSLRLQSPLPPVRVRLRGTASALQGLPKDAAGNPTVSVVADMTGFTLPGEGLEVELKALVPDGVEVVDLSPALVAVYLEAKP